ncbi:MAG: hypothetical protein Q8S57_08900 [Methanoregula sp.]|nr:hypothetical protein [Methanoregula sp.]
MRSISANEYDRKLHYTATPHEEGLLPERCLAPGHAIACNASSSSEQETDLPKEQEEQR